VSLLGPSQSFLMASLLAAFAAAPATARADLSKVECIEADTKAQDARREGKLSVAAEQLRRCSDAACPGMVRDDCNRRLDEVEKAQPTIVFEVKDVSGADVSAVSVTLDGKQWAEALEGKALPADPGKHVFAFTVAGYAPIERALVLTEGEKGRRERIVLPAPQPQPVPLPTAPVRAPALSVTPAPIETATASPSARGMGTQQVLGLTLGGAGVVGLGLGGVLGMLATSAWSKAKSDCGGSTSQCTNVSRGQSDRSTAEGDATISSVGFIAGGALLATGAVLFLTGARHRSESGTSLRICPSVGQGQTGLLVTGGF
jgi:hypothetical protein